MFSINIFVKVLLRSINYKHCKRFIESDQNFPLQFYVKSGEIGKILLVTRLENYHSAWNICGKLYWGRLPVQWYISVWQLRRNGGSTIFSHALSFKELHSLISKHISRVFHDLKKGCQHFIRQGLLRLIIRDTSHHIQLSNTFLVFKPCLILLVSSTTIFEFP